VLFLAPVSTRGPVRDVKSGTFGNTAARRLFSKKTHLTGIKIIDNKDELLVFLIPILFVNSIWSLFQNKKYAPPSPPFLKVSRRRLTESVTFFRLCKRVTKIGICY
jgi:hypothetical protein